MKDVDLEAALQSVSKGFIVQTPNSLETVFCVCLCSLRACCVLFPFLFSVVLLHVCFSFAQIT